jgi:hypothetical protein
MEAAVSNCRWAIANGLRVGAESSFGGMDSSVRRLNNGAVNV